MASAAQLAIVLKASGQSDVQRAFRAISKEITGIGSAVKAPINAVGSLIDALGRIGLAAQGIQSITSAATSLGQSLGVGLASQMENVRAQLLAFTKDGAAADAILRQIREEADKTPFAFQAMAAATASLLPAAKQSGTALMDLVKQAEILAASNPAQGLEGAAFSLKEALSGDFVSIIERFNLPRQFINKLKEEGVPALEIVSRAMQEMGLDIDLVANLSQTASGKFSTLKDAVDGLRLKAAGPILESLKTQIDRASDAIEVHRPLLEDVARVIGEKVASAVDRLGEVAGDVIHELASFGTMVRNIAGAHGMDLLSAAITAVEIRIREVFGDRIADMFHNTVDAAGKIIESFQNILKVVTPVVVEFGKWLANDMLPAASGFLKNTADKTAELTGILAEHESIVKGVAGAYIALMSAQALGGLAKLLGTVGAAVAKINVPFLVAQGIIAAWAGAYAADVGKVREYTNFLLETFAEMPGMIKRRFDENNAALAQWAREAVHNLRTFWENVRNDAIKAGRDIVQGLIDGLLSASPPLLATAARIVGSVISRMRQEADAHSPSEETFGLGVDIVEGLANGITGTTELAENAVEQMAGAVFGKMEQLQLEHQRRVEDAEREHQRRLSELQEELAGAKKVEDRQRINERILDEQRRFGDKLEDLDIDLGRRREDAARDAEQREVEAQQRRQETVADFSERIVDLQADALERVDDLTQRTAENIQRTIDDVAEKIQDARSKLAADSERLAEDFATRFGREGGTFDVRSGRDKEDFDRKQLRIVQDAARDREKIVRDHNDKLADLNRDMERATTDEQRRRIQERINETNREHRQRLTDFDAALRTKQTREQQDFDVRLERLREDFQKRQEEERKDHQTRLSRMAQDAVDRIAVMQREGNQRIAQLEQEKQQGLVKIAKDIDDKASLLARELAKKLGDASTIAMQTAADTVIGALKKTLQDIRNLGGGGSPSGASGERLFSAGDTLPSGFQTQSGDNVINDQGEVRVWRGGSLIHRERGGSGDNNGSSRVNPFRFGDLPEFADGGIVPGASGSRQLVVAHGGERITNGANRGGATINVTVQGSVVSEQQLTDVIWGNLKRRNLGGATMGLS